MKLTNSDQDSLEKNTMIHHSSCGFWGESLSDSFVEAKKYYKFQLSQSEDMWHFWPLIWLFLVKCVDTW